jgi:prephenate dehydrogenase
VLTPAPDTSGAALDIVQGLVTDCRALPLQMDAGAHDAAVAVTSHVPQVLASTLAALLLDLAPDQVRVSGQGLRDMTRLAGSDPALWSQILSANAGPVRAALEDFTGRLQALASALADGDGPMAAAALVGAGREGRDRIPGKHGGASSDYDVVPVLIADEPGQLAEVFVAAGAAGFNLEDVRIDHVFGRPSGLVEVAVRPGLGAALAAALRERGFDVRV